jgi:hypothetical protein
MDNSLYFSEPFNRSMAWIDMLLLANHSDNFFFKRGIRVDVKAGQIGYDLESLGKRWKWSRGKVERFLDMLEMDSQIVRQKTNVTTLISIVNYMDYQTDDKANNKANEHQIVNQTETNKNDKKEKNILFDDFWKLYNKSVDKKKCMDKWSKLSDKEIKSIFEHLPHYIKNTPDKTYRKNPITYLNGKCWNDEEYLIEKKETYKPLIIHE